MKKIASNELKAFLQDWLSWAEGRESRVEYKTAWGLCDNATMNWSVKGVTYELRDLFSCRTYPFGFNRFEECEDNETMHQDPNRLAWVRAALNDTLDTWELME